MECGWSGAVALQTRADKWRGFSAQREEQQLEATAQCVEAGNTGRPDQTAKLGTGSGGSFSAAGAPGRKYRCGRKMRPAGAERTQRPSRRCLRGVAGLGACAGRRGVRDAGVKPPRPEGFPFFRRLAILKRRGRLRSTDFASKSTRADEFGCRRSFRHRMRANSEREVEQ